MIRLRRNTIPAPPQDATSRHFLTWVERTFPPGSNFRFGGLLCQVDMITSDAGPQRRAFNGRLTYGVVPGLRDRFGGLVPSADALVGPGTMHLSFAEVQGGYLTGALRPVVDHWAAHQTSPSVKHRRLAPNTIPTPPMSTYPAAGSTLLAPAAYAQWVERTYRAGTRVTFPNGIVTLLGPLPPGARGVVERVQTEWGTLSRAMGRATGAPDYQFVYVRVTDARDRSGLSLSKFANHVMQIDSLYYYAAGENMTQAVHPLDDNWGAAAPTKRTSLPTSQRGVSMKHRRLAPNNRRTSKKHVSTNPYLHGTRSDYAEQILREHKLRGTRNHRFAPRDAVFAADADAPGIAEEVHRFVDDKFSTLWGTNPPGIDNVVVEFDTDRDPDERIGRGGAVWFGDELPIEHAHIISKRRGQVTWNPAKTRRTSKRRTSRGKMGR